MTKRIRAMLTLPDAVHQALMKELSQQPEDSLTRLLSRIVRSHYTVHKPIKVDPEQQRPDPKDNLPPDLLPFVDPDLR